ncbi:DNA (cytosine-5)-methyltransferase 1 [Paraburkholderia sp. BL27I4N3]|uniref:DNA (cytosine-5-)-methyltransferase n=1 Tax=Paraburkholderia sp. BL27I4N3 TaxID=1938805 RepID=UPI000E25FD4F|nr:DNA (cytosine-5-)-methyltransferase [Paraburkholderia sp. BL27I4N3]REE17112.1 DNA (cytosine-5)-methyltransferase 1 [Paraburkholderia sp. BL27I4N3]
MEQQNSTLNVIELFAGVGGFRLGLESVPGQPFRVTLSNQFEPSNKIQHASLVYHAHWPHGEHLNQDINEVLASPAGQRAIRDAAPDVLVAGFPCQDYSVAKPTSQSKGIEGKKGVLWWSIAELLQQRITDGAPVKYLVLENVDRLLSSPASAKGRDFAIVLSTLNRLGYAVEWRVINAADYGFPQKRKRVFIVAYHNTTGLYTSNVATHFVVPSGWVSTGVLGRALPAVPRAPAQAARECFKVSADPFMAQSTFQPLPNGKSPFANAGFMFDGYVYSASVDAAIFSDYTQFTGTPDALTLGDVVNLTTDVHDNFYISNDAEEAWRMAKGAKCLPRQKDGFKYNYTEGAMAFPDPLDKPARTIITSEGGASASRTRHAVRATDGRLRRLVPEELEGLNGFPRGFTQHPEVSDSMRAFLMGNALVTGLVTRIATALHDAHQQETRSSLHRMEFHDYHAFIGEYS